MTLHTSLEAKKMLETFDAQAAFSESLKLVALSLKAAAAPCVPTDLHIEVIERALHFHHEATIYTTLLLLTENTLLLTRWPEDMQAICERLCSQLYHTTDSIRRSEDLLKASVTALLELGKKEKSNAL